MFAALSFASRSVLFSAAREIEYQLRGELFAHLQRMPQSYFAGQRTGDLMSRAVNDVNNVRMFLGMGLLEHRADAGALRRRDRASCCTWTGSSRSGCCRRTRCSSAVARFFGRRMHQATIDAQEQLGALSSAVQENAAGVFVVRSNAMEDRERARFAHEAARPLPRACCTWR